MACATPIRAGLLLGLTCGQDDDPPVRLDAHALGADPRILDQREVHDASLERRHRLQLDDLAGLDDALGGTRRDIAQLLLAASAIVLDVDRDPVVLALAPRHYEVHEVLEAGELLAAPADEHPQVLAADIELRRLGPHGDLHGAREVHQPQELLEHRLGLLEDCPLLVRELLDRLGGDEWRRLACGPIRRLGPRLADRVLASLALTPVAPPRGAHATPATASFAAV